MNLKRVLKYLAILLVLLLFAGCSLLETEDVFPPTDGQQGATPKGTEVSATLPAEALPSETEIIPMEEEPAITEEPASMGQIIYIFGGEVWRYIVDLNSTEQVTSGGSGFFSNLTVSGDGVYAAYNQDDMIHILNLNDGSEQVLADVGTFVNWGEAEGEIYTFESDLTCEDFADDIQNQDQINYDVLRVNISNPSNFITLTNISGGMKLPQGVFNYGTWASMASCGCYSECGGFSLWYLPTTTQQAHPVVGTNAGEFSFSPNFDQVTFSLFQSFGYHESPLIVSDLNYSISDIIYEEPEIAVINPSWSPTGEWIAFTALEYDPISWEVENQSVIMIHPDGSEQRVVESTMGWLVDWSPDGQYLLYKREGSPSDTYTIYSLLDSSKSLLPFTADEYRPVDWGNLP